MQNSKDGIFNAKKIVGRALDDINLKLCVRSDTNSKKLEKSHGMARCIRAEANISKSLWPYAARHAQYLRNRSYQGCTSSTAYELFTNVKPDLRSLHTLGAPCIFYVEGHKQNLDIRGKEGIYLGINPRNKGYVFNPINGRVITSCNVFVHQQALGENFILDSKPQKIPKNSKDEQTEEPLIVEEYSEEDKDNSHEKKEQPVESRPRRKT